MGYGAGLSSARIPQAPAPTETFDVGDGDPQVRVARTTDEMRDKAMAAQWDRPTVELAQAIVIPWARRGPRHQVDAIARWVAARWVFVRDPVDVEQIKPPQDALQELRATGIMAGDCDCCATLCAALGLCVGFLARFVVVGRGRGRLEPFEHTWAELYDDETWAALDVTQPRELAGRFPRGGRVRIYHI